MARPEKIIGEIIEQNVLSLFKMWGLDTEITHIDGHDICVNVNDSHVYIDVKGMKQWVVDTSCGNNRRRGRAVIRKDSHECLINNEPSLYVFCPYSMDGKYVTFGYLYYTQANTIKVKNARICIPWKNVLDYPVLTRKTFSELVG